MADSKPVDEETPSKPIDEETTPNPNLLHCGICSAIVDKPKVLPCLHTFCTNCLVKWSESATEKNPIYAKAISCPSCHDDSPLPEGGVKELTNNIFVGKLKERESIQKSLRDDGKITCTSCEEDAQAVGHCQDCGEFLCENCLQSHKRLLKFKEHNVSSVEELSADSVTFPKHGVCPKHVGEVLKFYCETCEEPICRDCIVIEHPAPDHQQTDIDIALQKRKALLETLQQQSEDIPEAIDAAISEDEKLLIALDSNVEQVINQYKKTEKLAEGEFMQTIQEFQTSRRLVIESHKDTLQNQKSRVCAALAMNNEMMQKGMDVDLGMMYSPLSKAMTALDELRPNKLHFRISDVDFLPNKELISSLGIISGYKHWSLVKTIQSHWGLMKPKGVAYSKNGDIVIANNAGDRRNDGDVVIIGNDGLVKKTFRTKIPTEGHAAYMLDYLYYFAKSDANPWGMTVGQDGCIFVTDESQFIKVYDEDGQLLRKMDILFNYRGSHALRGLASDSKGMMYVGHAAGYITAAFENGGELLSFATNEYMCPDFIAVSPEGHLIYSGTAKITGGQELSRVIIHKNTPNEGRSYIGREYTFYPPISVDVTKFKPTGICIHEGDQVVFVANAGAEPGVYCYSLTGDYLGIVTKEVTSPQGIALSGDEQELAVCDGNEIKLFRPQ